MKVYLSATAVCMFLIVGACGKAEAPANAPATSENRAETEAPTTPADPVEMSDTATIAPSAFTELPSPYNTADYSRGRRTWKLCQSCHMTAEGAGSLVGPNLYGIFGREAGSAEGFAYSEALQTADFTWTPEKLDHWLENPRTFLPGNRMTFAGVRKPEDRIAVTAYLMSETGYAPAAETETPEE